MSTTVAEIAAAALDAVDAAITGVVFTATIEMDDQLDYDPVSRSHILKTTTYTGRAVIETKAAIKSKFPAYTAGPDDILILLVGFSQIPDVGWRVIIDGNTRDIKAVGDIVGAGELAEVVAA